ncbi:MAG: hypothetical protein JNM17_04655 [Archangium sp.]|nr:hypothetical protein [Archangium sp.]
MRSLLFTLAALSSFSALADEGHDKFNVLEIKIGDAIEGRKDFTCDKDDPKEVKERRCVKFLDPRCEGKPGKLGVLRYGDAAPRGCFLDTSSAATYLDGKLQQTPNTGDATDKRPILKPLVHLQLIGTQSRPSKVFRMWYVVAPDSLSDDSKLYGALFAKYGEPSEKRGADDVRWKNGDTSLKATCNKDRNCDLVVEDLRFAELERKWQEEADAKEKNKKAPAPPKL